MKVRAAQHLIAEGLARRRVLEAIRYLDQHIPEWYRLPLYGLSGKAVIDLRGRKFAADESQQGVLPVIANLLDQLKEEGPLGRLRQFSDYIDMHPDVLGGNPVLRGTRLETQFIAALADRGMSPQEIATTYHLEDKQVQRALEFNEAVA